MDDLAQAAAQAAQAAATVAMAKSLEAFSKAEYLERELDRVRNDIKELEKTVYGLSAFKVVDKVETLQEDMATLKAQQDVGVEKKTSRRI